MRLFSMYRWVRQHYQFQLRGRRFLEAPWSGGLVLLFSVAVAMLLANLPWTAEYYQRVLNIDIALVVRGPGSLIDWMFPRGLTLQTFVNDGLMVVFFFLIGLEIKREIVIGQLSSVRKAILPVLAALGGMVVPALIYFSFNAGTVAAPGWGIPTATDIAFAIGILSIFSDRVPISLKIFLTALAVADDLGAILVIALFYGEEVNLLLLAIAILILVGIYFLNKVGETRIMFYLVPAFVVWALFYYSGIHSTLSGVVIAMFIVNPIPPRQATAKSIFQPAPSGISASFVFTASQLARKIPSGLPTSNPKKMPVPTAPACGVTWKIRKYSSESIETPALANAKIGIIKAEIVSRGKIAILMGSFASAVLGTVLIFLFSKKKTRI